jgi:hypothetical protein
MQTRTALKFVLMWVQVLVIVSLLGPLPVRGQVQGPIMSPFIEIWTDVFENNHPSVAYNSRRNEFMVVWYTKESNNKWSIWGRRVFMNGTLGDLIEIKRIDNMKYFDPVIAYNPVKDEYLVVFNADNIPGWIEVKNIQATLIDWAGTPMKNMPVSDVLSLERDPAVVFNDQDHQYLVVMTRDRSGIFEIWGQRLDAEGNRFGEIKLAGVDTEDRSSPKVAYNPLRNNYLVVYHWEEPGSRKILGVTCSADLSTISLERDISGGWDDFLPAIVFGGNEFMTVWERSGYIVKARRIDEQGDPVGPVSGFTTMPFNNPIYPRNADVAYLGRGLFLSVAEIWDPMMSDEGDIAGRLLKVGLDQPAEDLFYLDSTANFQGWPSVACSPYGSCLVAYVHNPFNFPNGDYEIRGRLLNFGQMVFLPLILNQ